MHISIKWKITIPITLILLTCSIIIYEYSRHSLLHSYNTNLQKLSESNKKILNSLSISLVDHSSSSLSLITAAFKDKLTNKKQTDLNKESNDNNFLRGLEDKMHIDGFFIFSENLDEVLSSMPEIKKTIQSSIIKQKENFLAESEEIICMHECHYVRIRRNKIPGGQVFYTGTAISIFELANRFSSISKSKIILLSTYTENRASQNKNYTLANKQLRFEISSAPFLTSNFLTEIEKASKLNNNSENIISSGIDIKIKDAEWHISLTPAGIKGFYYILLDEVTHEKAELNKAILSAAIILFFSFSFVLLLIFTLIKKPLERLKLLGEAIPLLGSGQFSSFRLLIGKPLVGHIFDDEVLAIHQTGYEVSRRLETLEGEVTHNADQLAKALNDVSDQHAFLEQLINHSQVYVLAMDDSFRVNLANELLSNFLGIKKDHLPGKHICQLFHSNISMAMQNKLSNLQYKKSTQQEIEIKSNTGKDYWINWIHYRMPEENSSNRYLSVGIDTTYRKKSEQEIKTLAERDPLTNLYNRRTLSNKILELIKQHNKRKKTLAFMYIDLNKFKLINDRFGHQAGDQYLQQVALVLSQFTLDNSCIVGRIGGDEFVLVAKNVSDGASISSLAEAIVKRLNAIKLPDINGFFHFGGSVGIAMAPEHGMTLDILLHKADLSMYSAKQDPNVKVSIYSNNIAYIPISNYEKRRFINQVINNEDLNIYIQPIFDIGNQEICGFECLSRLPEDNHFATISTQDVFLFAESSGMSAQLDYYIIKKIIDQIVQKQEKKSPQDNSKPFSSFNIATNYYLSINISAKSILDNTFQRDIINLLKMRDYKLPQLTIEVTETAAIDDEDSARAFFTTLQELGIKLSLDDFGKGYSSLASLRSFPFNVVKVDAEFARQIDNNHQDQIILDSLVQASRRLGLEILIEGVENYNIFKYLSNLSIDMIQGYYVGKPMPIESLPVYNRTFIENNKST